MGEYSLKSLDTIKGDYCVLLDESLNNMVKEKQVDKDEMKALNSDLNKALHSLK